MIYHGLKGEKMNESVINWRLVLPFVWLGLVVLLGIVEAMTISMTTLWFAIGGVLAMAAALLGLPLWVQLSLFFVVSLVLLFFTRPIAIKYLKVGKEKTNVETMAGSLALVTKPVTRHERGEARIQGQIWTVISDDPDINFVAGEEAIVDRVEGVKAVLKKKP
jgi:membrane protein implicated in regulation of membrane protease activity